MGLARSLLGMQEVFLNCAGSFGRDHLGGLGDEGENDIDLESQTHNVSVDIFRLVLVHATQLLTIPRQRTYQHHPEFQMKIQGLGRVPRVINVFLLSVCLETRTDFEYNNDLWRCSVSELSGRGETRSINDSKVMVGKFDGRIRYSQIGILHAI